MKIYIACLASYNNGTMHGEWIDASSDTDEMQEHVDRILRASPYPNVTVTCHECDGDGETWVPGSLEEGTAPHKVDCPACKGTGTVPSAEEFAIHDFDGIPSSLGEYCGLQAVADYVEFFEEFEGDHDADTLAAIIADAYDMDEARTRLEDHYCGTYSNFRDYADEAAEEMIACHTADGKAPQALVNYFDYEAFARDLAMDMHTVDVPAGVAVFHAH
jgi:antirestriction protein